MLKRIRCLFAVVCFAFFVSGCGGLVKVVGQNIPRVLSAESGLISALDKLDDREQTRATTREEVEAWRKIRDEIRESIKAFHVAVVTLTEVLLGGK